MAAFGEQCASPHVERHAMGRHIARVMHQRPAGQRYTDLQPVGGWDKLWYGGIGAERVEQSGDIGARRNHPTRSTRNGRARPLRPGNRC